jgi:hypothetical protein
MIRSRRHLEDEQEAAHELTRMSNAELFDLLQSQIEAIKTKSTDVIPDRLINAEIKRRQREQNRRQQGKSR